MVYGLERDGRTVYCSSFAEVTVLLAMGWTLSDSGHWARRVCELTASFPLDARSLGALPVERCSCRRRQVRPAWRTHPRAS